MEGFTVDPRKTTPEEFERGLHDAKLVFNGTRVEFAEGETANVNVEDLPSGTDVVETNVNAKISCDQDQQTVSLDKSVGVSAVVVNGDSVTKLEVTQQVTLVGSADGDKELIQFSGSGEKQVTLTAGSLTLGQEGSTANAGKISVALTVQNQTSLTVKEGSYTLSDVTASTGGKIEVSNGNVAVDKLTLDGGNLTAENGQLTAQTMTLGKSSVISLGDAITQIATLVIDAIQDAVHTITGEMKTDSLQVKEGASSIIRIGTSTAQGDQENKAGRLEIAKNFIMKGLTFFLDPVYQNGTIADASKLSVASTSIDGKIAVGENSYAVLGSQGADADQKMIDDSGIAWDGTTNSALFVAQPVTITSTGGILVDKTATATSSIADGSVTFAANSVLVANARLRTMPRLFLSGISTSPRRTRCLQRKTEVRWATESSSRMSRLPMRCGSLMGQDPDLDSTSLSSSMQERSTET